MDLVSNTDYKANDNVYFLLNDLRLELPVMFVNYLRVAYGGYRNCSQAAENP